MLRKVVCAVVAVVIFAGWSNAAEQEKKKKKKADGGIVGTVKKIDASAGTITVAVKAKKQLTDREFKIADTTKIIVVAGKNNRTELTGKAGLGQLKEGANVSIKIDADGKVTEVVHNTAKKKKKKADQ